MCSLNNTKWHRKGLIMDIQHIIERWFVIVTIVLSLGLALLFGAIQAGLI